MIIRGIFTNTKLSPERMNSETTVPYIVANECPGLKRGDLVQLVGYDSKFQVVWTYASSREQESYETVTISEEHPESFPIIIALDETGSMGKVPKYLIDNTLPDCVASIMKAGIDNPQICFMAFGDVEGCYEEAPLQVGQFESSDELMEKWLRKVDLEGRGGGNNGEDPHMCWYFAANHIKTDALEKRGIKGCLITISDEPIHKTLPKEAVTHYIGDECGEDLATSFIYRECAEKWDIYHIHVEHGGYYGVERVSNSWKPYVGDNLIISDKEHVGESIARIVSNSYGQQTNS